MAFKELYISMVPDAGKQRSKTSTSMCEIFVVMVKNLDEAIDECKRYVESEGVQSILLCPGFSFEDAVQVSKAAGEEVAIHMAMRDQKSSQIVTDILGREGWF